MIVKASQDFDVDLDRSWLIGDKASDIQTGLAVGLKSIFVLTSYGNHHRTLLGNDIVKCTDIKTACHHIISHAY